MKIIIAIALFVCLLTSPVHAIKYSDIRSECESMTDAQFDVYAKLLEGKAISDVGWVEDVKGNPGNYRILIDRDSPNQTMSLFDIYLLGVPDEVAMFLEKDEPVTYQGRIVEVSKIFRRPVVTIRGRIIP